ncbi:MAG: polysaccharide biosynthesis protein [Candidatus Rokubacteria bacterium]|nr:polysaccharide biosynthesis protein [Candidatus Rokubacteria bacterium]
MGLGVGLVISPALLSSLGLARFGFWSVLWALTASLGLLDLRVVAAITPLGASAWALGDHARFARLVRGSVLCYAVLGTAEILGAALATRVPALVQWIPEAVRDEGRTALVLAVTAFAVGSLSAVFTGALHALQRFDLAAAIAVAAALIRAVALVAIAYGGGGLIALVLAELAVASGQCLAAALAARGLVARSGLEPPRGPSALPELVRFGSKLQVAHVAHLITLHADKLLLSALAGLVAVAYYELASKIGLAMRGLPLILVSAVLPTVSAMDAVGDRERLWALYRAATRLLIMTATPVLVFVVTGASAILMLWARVEAPEARDALCLLAVGYYLNLVTGMANNIVIGAGKPHIEMRRSLLAGGLNLVLSAVLIHVMGVRGAALGTALALAAGSWYLLHACQRHFGRPLLDVLMWFRGPLVAALPITLVAGLIHRWADGSREGAAMALVLSAVVIGVTFLALALRDGNVAVRA